MAATEALYNVNGTKYVHGTLAETVCKFSKKENANIEINPLMYNELVYPYILDESILPFLCCAPQDTVGL